MSLWIPRGREGDGARRKSELSERVRFTESIMTHMFLTKKESQFNHYSGANEVSSVALTEDDQWRINHRQRSLVESIECDLPRVGNPECYPVVVRRGVRNTPQGGWSFLKGRHIGQ